MINLEALEALEDVYAQGILKKEEFEAHKNALLYKYIKFQKIMKIIKIIITSLGIVLVGLVLLFKTIFSK